MAEFIKREALLEDISESVVFTLRRGERSAEIRGANKVIDRIKSAPAADVVEVVRCKDCVHSILTFGTYICDNIEAPWFNDEFAIDMMSNDFCSYGQKKEGAEE